MNPLSLLLFVSPLAPISGGEVTAQPAAHTVVVQGRQLTAVPASPSGRIATLSATRQAHGPRRQQSPQPLNATAAASDPSGQPLKIEGLSSLQTVVGHTTTDKIDVYDALIGAPGTFPIGAYVSSSMLQPYVGCKIVGVRYAVGQSIGRTNVFYTTVDANGVADPNLVKQRQQSYEGWNTVFFSDANTHVITGDENILFGYEYIESQKMVDEDRGAICCVGEAEGNEFLIYTAYNGTEGWYQVNNIGMLCVQLIIDISSLPAVDAAIDYFDYGFIYKHQGDAVEPFINVLNSGREAFNSVTVNYQFDDRTPVSQTITETVEPGKSVSWEPIIPETSSLAIGQHTIRFAINAINGLPVTNPYLKQVEGHFFIYANPIQRQKNYVEQYTSQDSYLGPMTTDCFDKALQGDTKSVLVNVYDPYSPLALHQADYLSDLYAFTYPSFTINRAYYPGEDNIAYEVGSYAIQFFTMPELNFVPGLLQELFVEDWYREAFATIDLTPTYDTDTRRLDIDVNGTLSPDFTAIFGNVGVTLMLTEDGLVSDQSSVRQVGDELRVYTDMNYVHNNVLRHYVTAPTGDMATTQGNTFSGHYTTTIPDGFKPENMHLVGIVTRHATQVSKDNLLEMDVVGCNSFDLSDLTSGITTLADEATPAAPRYFNMQGQPVPAAQLTPGVYIERVGHVSRKVLRK